MGALIEAFPEGVPASVIAESGIDFEDLPPETPIELENGVVITAEVAESFETLADPGELIGALLTDPGEVLTALANLGADMSEEEREESQKVVVAAVVAAGVAVQSAVAAASLATGGGGAPAGGSSSSPKGGGDGGVPTGKEGGTKRARPRRKVKTKNRIKPSRPRSK